jgi:hypothetical protein
LRETIAGTANLITALSVFNVSDVYFANPPAGKRNSDVRKSHM